jgi:hypothetical protein
VSHACETERGPERGLCSCVCEEGEVGQVLCLKHQGATGAAGGLGHGAMVREDRAVFHTIIFFLTHQPTLHTQTLNTSNLS